jgi:hypothetical protein
VSVQINVYLRAGTGNDVYLRGERFTHAIDVFLFANNGPANDVYLRPEGRLLPASSEIVIPGFPTQYSGLRFFKGTVQELCLVATADAPSGDCPRISKNGTTYAIYLVDTSDPNASHIRIAADGGTKAMRLKT